MGQLVEGKRINPTDAARQAYDTKHPKTVGYEMINSPAVKQEITTLLDHAGLTKPSLIWKLKEFIDDQPDDRLSFDAWKEAAKIQKLYPDQVNKSLNVNVSGESFLEKLAQKENKQGDKETAGEPRGRAEGYPRDSLGNVPED